MNSGEGKVVCVTGASGYIASWLVKELLLRGYTVRATVRNLNDPKNTEHLLQLEGAGHRLRLFEADLLNNGSFASAIKGCQCVFHTASPCLMATEDPQRELLDPAIRGTLNVLGSCSKSPSVKTVVLTSSMAAVLFNGKPLNPDVTVDEGWFSDPEYCRNTQYWYGLSKTLAEEAAWKFAKENNINLVVINPAMVIGPLLQPTLNASCAHVLKLINGSKTYDNYSPCLVHIKDVVEAHIRAFEIPTANGRYCLVESVAHHSEMVQMLKNHFPTLKLPEKCADDKPFMPIYQVSKEKVKSMGIDYIPTKIGLKETVESLKEKKFVSF